MLSKMIKVKKSRMVNTVIQLLVIISIVVHLLIDVISLLKVMNQVLVLNILITFYGNVKYLKSYLTSID